jgi:hypothetical protein
VLEETLLKALKFECVVSPEEIQLYRALFLALDEQVSTTVHEVRDLLAMSRSMLSSQDDPQSGSNILTSASVISSQDSFTQGIRSLRAMSRFIRTTEEPQPPTRQNIRELASSRTNQYAET